MDLELFVWGYIPILIGLFLIGGSFYLTAKRKNLFGLVVSLLILGLNGLAIYIQAQIITGAYPTYTPHIFILISLILLVVQKFVKKKGKTFANSI